MASADLGGQGSATGAYRLLPKGRGILLSSLGYAFGSVGLISVGILNE